LVYNCPCRIVGKAKLLAGLNEQLYLHEELYAWARKSFDVTGTHGMLKTSRMLRREASKSYNRILHKPMNHIPTLLTSFQAVDEEGSWP